jgi:exopolysaccharide biosynthesis WecB/TagA/CpsF family protein
MRFDALDKEGILAWLRSRDRTSPFAYLVTPNADHVVRAADEGAGSEIAEAYRTADLCVCDSRVLALLARLKGLTLDVAPGSDLVADLLGSPELAGRRICLIGGDMALLQRLEARLPARTEVVQHIPPMGLLQNDRAMQACVDLIIAHPSDYILLAVGSPQQELIALRAAKHGQAKGTALCIGAAVAFFTGLSPRAPRWMQMLALEWLHRLASDPRRMWKRYLLHSSRIIPLAFRS